MLEWSETKTTAQPTIYKYVIRTDNIALCMIISQALADEVNNNLDPLNILSGINKRSNNNE